MRIIVVIYLSVAISFVEMAPTPDDVLGSLLNGQILEPNPNNLPSSINLDVLNGQGTAATNGGNGGSNGGDGGLLGLGDLVNLDLLNQGTPALDPSLINLGILNSLAGGANNPGQGGNNGGNNGDNGGVVGLVTNLLNGLLGGHENNDKNNGNQCPTTTTKPTTAPPTTVKPTHTTCPPSENGGLLGGLLGSLL